MTSHQKDLITPNAWQGAVTKAQLRALQNYPKQTRSRATRSSRSQPSPSRSKHIPDQRKRPASHRCSDTAYSPGKWRACWGRRCCKVVAPKTTRMLPSGLSHPPDWPWKHRLTMRLLHIHPTPCLQRFCNWEPLLFCKERNATEQMKLPKRLKQNGQEL